MVYSLYRFTSIFGRKLLVCMYDLTVTIRFSIPLLMLQITYLHKLLYFILLFTYSLVYICVAHEYSSKMNF